ncbi:MAG: AMP-binding protein [Rhodospirillaceae bacterium]|jgi:cyclohexanecarboxylate-CoA ligase|nr:AMP-binding protein [Rhodospirillaceae bacterium]
MKPEAPEAIIPEKRAAAMTAQGLWFNRLILDDLDVAVAARPDTLAIIAHRSESGRSESGTSKSLTYSELDHASRQVAHGLLANGVGAGDVVSFQLPNWWQFIALHLGCVRIGAVSNPLMPIFRERELRFMLGHAGSKLFIAPRRFRNYDYTSMAERLRDELPALDAVFHVGGDAPDTFEESFLSGDAVTEEQRPGPDDVTQILYTSGTTGEPKGVMHTANTLIAALPPLIERMGLDESDVVLMASPLAHQTGFMYGMMMPILLRGTTVLQDFWAPGTAAELMADHGVTFTIASTPFLSDLADYDGLSHHDISRFRIFLSAGAPIPRSLVERATANLGAHILSGWGMTENGCVTCCSPGDPAEKIFGTDGDAVPGMAVAIVDDHGASVAPGVEGALRAQSPSMFAGYLKRPELYGVDADGWLDTGDLARMDAQGYIRITGRAKDIVIRGGENIPVVEVEEILYRHPLIRELAIVAMPDARLGERACLFVGLVPDSMLSLDEVIVYLDEQDMAKQYYPERLEVMDALPRTPSGKIQKFVLRDRAAAM